MNERLRVSVQHLEGFAHVKLGGVLDEDNDLARVADEIATATAFIHLGEVERINSCGTRDWVNWLASLEAKGTQSVFVECSPAIVAQMNLVGNFTRNAVVKSFYIPYFCSRCNEEKVMLVETEDLGPPPHEPPTSRCDGCELVMTFDDMPDQYFAFLEQQRKSAKDLLIPSEVARGSGGMVKTREKSRPSIRQLPSLKPPRQSDPELIATRPASAPRLDPRTGQPTRRASTRSRNDSISSLHMGMKARNVPAKRGRGLLVMTLVLAVIAASAALGYVIWTY